MLSSSTQLEWRSVGSPIGRPSHRSAGPPEPRVGIHLHEAIWRRSAASWRFALDPDRAAEWAPVPMSAALTAWKQLRLILSGVGRQRHVANYPRLTCAGVEDEKARAGVPSLTVTAASPRGSATSSSSPKSA